MANTRLPVTPPVGVVPDVHQAHAMGVLLDDDDGDAHPPDAPGPIVLPDRDEPLPRLPAVQAGQPHDGDIVCQPGQVTRLPSGPLPRIPEDDHQLQAVAAVTCPPQATCHPMATDSGSAAARGFGHLLCLRPRAAVSSRCPATGNWCGICKGSLPVALWTQWYCPSCQAWWDNTWSESAVSKRRRDNESDPDERPGFWTNVGGDWRLTWQT